MSVSKPSAVASVKPATVTLAMRPVMQEMQDKWLGLSQRWAAELKDQHSIMLKYEFIGEREWLAKLAAWMAGDALPDLIELWPRHVVALGMNRVKGVLAPLSPSEGGIPWEVFLSGAIASGKIDGQQHGMPWHRRFCLPDYASLYVSAATKDRAASLKVMRYLTEIKQQEDCFTLLQWYPTRIDVNERLGSCSLAGSDYRYLPLTEQQRQVLEASSEVLERTPLLEKALKGVGRMLAEITFNLHAPNGILSGESNAPKNVQVAVVPVEYNPKYYSHSTFPGALKDGIVVGALIVNEAGVLVGVPKGDFCVWVQGDQVRLLDSAGNPIKDYQGGLIEPLYGSHPPTSSYEHHEGVFAIVAEKNPTTIQIRVGDLIFYVTIP